MRFTFRALADEDAEAILGWRYEPPYDRYDPVNDDDVPGAVASGAWFAADDASTGDLVGFVVFHEGDGEVEVGLGLRPDLTGQGLGAGFVEAIVGVVRDRWDTGTVVLEVLPWNERAMRAYEAAGFARGPEHDKTFPDGAVTRFVAMRRSVGASAT